MGVGAGAHGAPVAGIAPTGPVSERAGVPGGEHPAGNLRVTQHRSARGQPESGQGQPEHGRRKRGGGGDGGDACPAVEKSAGDVSRNYDISARNPSPPNKTWWQRRIRGFRATGKPGTYQGLQGIRI